MDAEEVASEGWVDIERRGGHGWILDSVLGCEELASVIVSA
jgi:hypothetical protein